MTSERTTLLQLKKSLVHNERKLCFIQDYIVGGDDACREICITRLEDKSAYRVWHYDFLEKFCDIPEEYFSCDDFEFNDFEKAIEFIENNFGITLNQLK